MKRELLQNKVSLGHFPQERVHFLLILSAFLSIVVPINDFH